MTAPREPRPTSAPVAVLLHDLAADATAWREVAAVPPGADLDDVLRGVLGRDPDGALVPEAVRVDGGDLGPAESGITARAVPGADHASLLRSPAGVAAVADAVRAAAGH